MLNKITNLFKYKLPKPRKDARRFDGIKKYWGHNVSLGNITKTKKYWRQNIYGILSPTPRVGDEIVFKSANEPNKLILAVFIESQGKSDPADWFNAEIEFIGYVDEFPKKKITNEIHPNAERIFLGKSAWEAKHGKIL